MNLGMAYAANIDDMLQIDEGDSLMAASTQIFPVLACSSQIVRDPVLCSRIGQALWPVI